MWLLLTLEFTFSGGVYNIFFSFSKVLFRIRFHFVIFTNIVPSKIAAA